MGLHDQIGRPIEWDLYAIHAANGRVIDAHRQAGANNEALAMLRIPRGLIGEHFDDNRQSGKVVSCQVDFGAAAAVEQPNDFIASTELQPGSKCRLEWKYARYCSWQCGRATVELAMM